jgi:hypothetical protein
VAWEKFQSHRGRLVCLLPMAVMFVTIGLWPLSQRSIRGVQMPSGPKSEDVATDVTGEAARAALRQRLAETEERIARGERNITQQREIVAQRERNRNPVDHAKYLLAGLQLLQAVHRDNRNRLLEELNGHPDPA